MGYPAWRWKAAATEQLTSVHLYLNIAKSGYLFHGFSGGMNYKAEFAVEVW